jgi:hypothetical protein
MLSKCTAANGGNTFGYNHRVNGGAVGIPRGLGIAHSAFHTARCSYNVIRHGAAAANGEHAAANAPREQGASYAADLGVARRRKEQGGEEEEELFQRHLGIKLAAILTSKRTKIEKMLYLCGG